MRYTDVSVAHLPSPSGTRASGRGRTDNNRTLSWETRGFGPENSCERMSVLRRVPYTRRAWAMSTGGPMTLGTILLLLAFVCFVLAAFNATIKRVSLVPLGLALW